jgi:hypothetical protein
MVHAAGLWTPLLLLALVISLHGCNDDAAAVVVESAEPQMQAYFDAQKMSEMTTAIQKDLTNEIVLERDIFRFTKEVTIGEITWGLTFGLDACQGLKSAVIDEIKGAFANSKFLEKDAQENVEASFELDIEGGTFKCTGDARVYISEFAIFPGMDVGIKLVKTVRIPRVRVSVSASLVLGMGSNARKHCLQDYSNIAVEPEEEEEKWATEFRSALEAELNIPPIVSKMVPALEKPLGDLKVGNILKKVFGEYVINVGSMMDSLDVCIDP